MVELIYFVLGTSMGSFIGAAVWRLQEGQKIIRKEGVDSSRSICEHCHHKLVSKDLIPIFSWLWLRGKCRYCKHSIHWQHPIIELSTGLLFLASWLFWPENIDSYQDWQMFILWLVFLSGLIGLAVYDIKHLEIDNRIIYPMTALVMIYRFYDALFLNGGAEAMKELSLGLIVGGGLFLLLFYISKESWIGGGDVKLGFFFGAWLGPAKAAVALAAGFYSAFLVVAPLLMFRKIKRKQPVPFGPFLIFGIIVATLWGQNLLDWYNDKFI